MDLPCPIDNTDHSIKPNVLRMNDEAEKYFFDWHNRFVDEANIKTLPYVDYEKFVMYNIKDVLLQFGIENKCKDLGCRRRKHTMC